MLFQYKSFDTMQGGLQPVVPICLHWYALLTGHSWCSLYSGIFDHHLITSHTLVPHIEWFLAIKRKTCPVHHSHTAASRASRLSIFSLARTSVLRILFFFPMRYAWCSANGSTENLSGAWYSCSIVVQIPGFTSRLRCNHLIDHKFSDKSHTQFLRTPKIGCLNSSAYFIGERGFCIGHASDINKTVNRIASWR